MKTNTIEKQAGIIDMMITMHSILADRYSVKSKALEISLLGVATILISFTFLDPAVLSQFKINAFYARIIIGCLSISIFFMSIVSLVVDWKGKAVQHREGFRTLVKLKSETRDLMANNSNMNEEDVRVFIAKCSLITNQIIPIPDSDFNNLKYRHLNKVELSKLISKYPGSSLFLLKLKLRLSGSVKSLFNKTKKC